MDNNKALEHLCIECNTRHCAATAECSCECMDYSHDAVEACDEEEGPPWDLHEEYRFEVQS